MDGVQIKEYPNCFGCGATNPIGLRLRLRMEGQCLVTEFVPGEEHQGWPGVVHGGIIASLLYEVLENLPYYSGQVTMIRRMETRLRRPAKTGDRITAKAWQTGASGREMNVTATLTTDDQELIANGNAELVKLTPGQRQKMGLD